MYHLQTKGWDGRLGSETELSCYINLLMSLIVRCEKSCCGCRCWMNDSHTQWILTVPVCLSMLASLAFLINVVRVLLTKLHCNSANPAPVGLRKAVRAALILIPLLGIHHILIPFRPEPQSSWEKVYQIFSAVMVSLQVRC